MLNNLIMLSNFPFFADFFLITSGILLTVVFSVLKVKSILKHEIQKPLSRCISLIFIMGAYLIIHEFPFFLAQNQVNFYYASVSLDSLGLFAKLVVCVFASIFFFIITDFLEDQNLESDFLLILYFATVGLVLLCVCNDLMSSYLSIELVSLSSYLLASFKKESNYSIEAGLKYFVIGSISSAFFLLGCSFIYANSGTIFFVELHHLLNMPSIEELKTVKKRCIETRDVLTNANDLFSTLEVYHNNESKYFLTLYNDLKTTELSLDFFGKEVSDFQASVLYDRANINFKFLEKIESVKNFLDNNRTGEVLTDSMAFFAAPWTVLPYSYCFTNELPSEFLSYLHFKRPFTMGQVPHLTKMSLLLYSWDDAETNLRARETVLNTFNDLLVYQKIILLEQTKININKHLQLVKEANEILIESKDVLKTNLALINQTDAQISFLENFSFMLVQLGIIFILFSVFIKLALAPFHLWSLDVYEGSPTASTFFFAVMTKLSLFMFLIRFAYTAMPTFLTDWQFCSLWVAIISLFVGSFGGLKQRKLKTLIAYSSINHMGYALLAFSMSSSLSLKFLIFYLVIYMLSGICIWFSIMLLRLKQRKKKYSKELSDLSQLVKTNPALAFSLSITFFSIAGLPPFVGFIAKVGIFLSLLKEEFYFFCIIAVLCSVVSTFYYIRIIKIMFFENALVGKLYYPITSKKVWLLSLCTFLLIFLFINPKLFFLIIHIVVE